MDSRPQTVEHIGHVRAWMRLCISALHTRATVHDQSKLVDPEVSAFDQWTPRLAETEYGSDEYNAALAGMRPALEHHYAVNSHHPEHYPNGMREMTLLDLVEMICDWKAAGERHADGGDLVRSIELNQERFGYSDELKSILLATARELEGLCSEG